MFCFSLLSFAAGLFEGQGALNGYQVGSWQLPVLDIVLDDMHTVAME